MTEKPNLHFVVDVEKKIQNKNIRNADSSILNNNQFERERERERERDRRFLRTSTARGSCHGFCMVP